MSILQISKIQHRSGNLVDLPQLDEAEFGWASDQRRLFIGKTTPNENVEIMTSYSRIAFSQIDGSVGNLNINPLTAQNGQPLVFDGTNWVNRGGIAGGLIDLGNIANVSIQGGAIGYVIETDGRGRLSWTPKTTVVAYIQTVSKANPGVVTTVDENLFVNGAAVTITGARGMTQLNGTGNTFYAKVLTANTFSLYQDLALSTPLNTTAYSDYAYTAVSATTTATNAITVANSAPFTVNAPVRFVGNIQANGGGTLTNLNSTDTYYIKTKPSGTSITVSAELLANGVAGNAVSLNTVTGLTANVYEEGGRILGVATGTVAGSGPAAGSNTLIQYNASGTFGASAGLSFDYAGQILQVSGNANVGNLNSAGIVTGTRIVSTVANGTSPFQVNSTTVVPNLRVNFAEISSNVNVAAQTTGVYYPVLASGSTTGNYTLAANSNISFNIATGVLSATGATLSGNATANNISIGNIANVGSNLNVTGNATANNISIGNIANVGANLNVTGNATANNISIGNIANVGANLNVTGNVNVTANAVVTGNATASRLVSTVATGTAPLTVTSTTRVANLNVSYANVTDFAAVTAQTTGVYYPVLAVGATSANYALAANSGISFNVATGVLSATGATLSGNASANNISIANIANVGANLNVTGNATANNLSIANIANVGANLNVTGNAAVTGRLSVTGNISFTGANISLGAVANVKITGGTSGYVLTTDGTGNLTFADPGALLAKPAGSNTQIQFNNNGVMSASANLTFNTATNNVTVTGNLVTTGNTSANNTTVTNTASVGNAAVTGNASANNLSIGNIANIGANLNVTGNAAVTGRLSVTGNISFSGPNVTLGGIGNVKITGGTSGYVVTTDGAGNLAFSDPGALLAKPAGSNTQLQFNTNNVMSASANLTFNTATNTLGVTGNITATGNATANNISIGNTATVGSTMSVGGNLAVTLNANVTGRLTVTNTANLNGGTNVAGNVVVTGGSFQGNGSGLTAIPAANVTGKVANAAYSDVAIAAANDVFSTPVAATESQLRVRKSGVNDAYLYNNTGEWGLYSTDGGNVLVYNRGSSTSTFYGSIVGGNVTASQGSFASVTSTGTVDATTPNVGSTGGLRLRANATSGQAYLQVTNSTATAQLGVWQSNSTGNIGWSGNLTTGGIFYGNAAGLTNLTGANVVGPVAKASTLAAYGGNGTAMTFNWLGQAGQPNWLWGGNDGINMYVYNPSNFSVNYATSAGSAGSAAIVTNPAQPSITSVGSSLLIGSSPAIKLSDFTQNAAPFGWSRLPNGLIIQWGSFGVTQDQYLTTTFPVAFTSFSRVVVSGGVVDNDYSENLVEVITSDTVSFSTYNAQNQNYTAYWIAVGF